EANASWSSAKSTRAGPKPAMANAARAASRVALKCVTSARCRTASASAPWPMPATRTAERSAVSTTAAAPSEIGQQCSRRSGSATMRLAITSSSVTACWKCAYGRSEEHTSELQSPCNLVCRLLLEKKKKQCRQLTSERTLEDNDTH